MTPATRAAVAAASAAFGVPVERIASPSRKRAATRARWAVIAILTDAGYSLSHIGRELGRDDSTIRHGVRSMANLSLEWFAKMSDAKAIAAIPVLSAAVVPVVTPPTRYQKYGDDKPTAGENRAAAERCAEKIRKYWRSRGVDVAAEIEPVATAKGVVYRIKSAGIPTTDAPL